MELSRSATGHGQGPRPTATATAMTTRDEQFFIGRPTNSSNAELKRASWHRCAIYLSSPASGEKRPNHCQFGPSAPNYTRDWSATTLFHHSPATAHLRPSPSPDWPIEPWLEAAHGSQSPTNRRPRIASGRASCPCKSHPRHATQARPGQGSNRASRLHCRYGVGQHAKASAAPNSAALAPPSRQQYSALRISPSPDPAARQSVKP